MKAMKVRGKKKILHFMRHAQALHNPKAEALRNTGCSYEVFLNQMKIDDAFDAPLTPLGHEESSVAGTNICPERLKQVQLLVTSPLTRAIQTAQTAFPPHILQRPHVLMEKWREISGYLLNAQRRPASELQQLHPSIDCTQLTEDDKLWTDVLEEKDNCAERAYQGLKDIWHRDEENIIVVAHGGIFAFMMLHPNIKPDEAMSQRFSNCEIRSCELTVSEGWSSDGGMQASQERIDFSLTKIKTDFLKA